MTAFGRVARWMLIGVSITVLVLVSGCAKGDAVKPVEPGVSKPPVNKPVAAQPKLEATDWECTGYANADEALVEVISGTAVTTRFEDGVVHGSTGVNTYEGGYTIDGTRLEIDPAFQVTERGGSPEAMDQESAFLAVIGRTKGYSIEGGVLTLTDAAGLRLATFEVAK
ncbi:MAG TPA: META domain-containing protein [Coriobacteriia bacterium]|nr:META domain-containing protein [Coriobacteriia bacterium]